MPTSAIAEINKETFERSALKHEVENVNQNLNRLIEVLTEVVSKPSQSDRKELETLARAFTEAIQNPPGNGALKSASDLDKLKDRIRHADWFEPWYNAQSDKQRKVIDEWLTLNLESYYSQPWFREGEVEETVERTRVLLQHASWKRSLVPASNSGGVHTRLNVTGGSLPHLHEILNRGDR